jgi:hypothetical protein
VKPPIAPFAIASLASLALAAAACGKEGRAAPPDPGRGGASATTAAAGDCGHTACGSNFFLDATSPADCAVGAKCVLTVKLVATGAYHINEDYPYKFKADDASGVEFLGVDPAGKNVFSKGASDWKKTDEKSGVMSVAFRPADRGNKSIAGTFKLSVCSAQNCQLEQQTLKADVVAR